MGAVKSVKDNRIVPTVVKEFQHGYSMEIDHIFIFSTQQGKEADELVSFGLTEGSSREHPGQGTINRKGCISNCRDYI